MATAHRWLVAHSIAHADQIILHGPSYGGYLTLLGLGKQPEQWAGGIAVTPVTDWATLVEDALPSMGIMAALLLGGDPQAVPERYRERSLITYADQVRAPILATQGQSDPRTPPRQIERYEARLRELGKPIEVVWFEEGHYGDSPEQMIAQQARMLEFTRQVATRQNGDGEGRSSQ